MKCLFPIVDPRFPNDRAAHNSVAFAQGNLPEIRVRRYKSTAVVDRHGPVMHDRTGKTHDPIPDRVNG
jgi:hypothetical protein